MDVDRTLIHFPEQVGQLSAELINCNHFVRLKKISFLGAIERFGTKEIGTSVSAGSRYDHSLGVARLIVSLGDFLNLTAGELRLAVAHALLHDVGHGPFSHSTEYFFSKRFKINHHLILQKIVEDGTSEVSNILRSNNIWFDYRRFLRQPSAFPAVWHLFYAPINVDTIEGILRSADFFGIKTSIDSAAVIDSIARKSNITVKPLDLFWCLKSQVYNNYIYDAERSIFDVILCDALFSIGDRVKSEDFFLDDEQFEDKYREPIQRQLSLRSEKRNISRKRHFKIDHRVAPRKLPNLSERYTEARGTHAGSRADN